MAWITPKTDWTADDYFNASDYNRIIGNISYLKALYESFMGEVTDLSLGAEKTYLSMIYAHEMNAIENAVQTINADTYSLSIGTKNAYSANNPTTRYTDMNRIESALLRLYNTMTAHIENRPRLAYTFGGQKGIRV